MAAILTDRFRVVLAENFRSRVELGETSSDASAIDLWLFFAKATQWPLDGGSEVRPNPIDNQKESFEIYDQMIGLKKISSSNIRAVIRNNVWESGKIYDAYRDDYGSKVLGSVNGELVSTVSAETKLYETSFYVVNDQFRVYKCISNNEGAASTVQPSTITSAPFTLSDGYIWKYMYSINANDFEKFKTDDYIPIPLSTETNNQLLTDSIYNIEIESGGTGYTTGAIFNIQGDGVGAQATITSVDGADGAITGVKIINPGNGYTYAQCAPQGGNNAILRPIISPKEKIAFSPESIALELGAYRLALSAVLDKNDFVFENDFRIVGIIYNPTINSTNSVTAIGTKKLKLDGAISTQIPDDAVITGSNGATGTFIEYTEEIIGGTTQYFIYFTQENIVGRGINSSGQRLSFSPGMNITIENGANDISATISTDTDSVSNPDISRGTGEIIYIDNRDAISRAADQTEDFKIILEF